VSPRRRDAFGVLARFLFTGDDLEKRLADLSGGERNRLQLARLMVLKPNFLILDEPTNHLDIAAREAVEEALGEFEGTILVVSHDRYFLDKVVNRLVEVRDRKLLSHAGNFSEFWNRHRRLMPRTAGRVSRRAADRKRARSGARSSGGREVQGLEKRIATAERDKVQLALLCQLDLTGAECHREPPARLLWALVVNSRLCRQRRDSGGLCGSEDLSC